MSDLKYWLALSLSPHVGNVFGRRLLSAFGDPENIFQMTSGELERIENFGKSRAKSIVGFNQWDMIQKTIDIALENNIRIVTFKDSSYPEGLKRLQDAPLVIYVNGDIANDDKYAVAVIGSRMSTEYGRRAAEKISRDLASAGLTVVSGMARGIDTFSHKGALNAGGRTVAVLGSGIDVVYPPENRKLVDLIASSGAVISEFPFGTEPNRENFPRRNRMISAMSLGVVVVEATVDSGSLITVGYALEQGKEVFAVPGNITSRNSKGTNDLIKKGAKLIDSAEEVISELRYQIKGILREERLLARKPFPKLTDEEAILCKYLCDEPKHIDKIVREAKVPISKALSILLNLELNGVVKQTDGKRFYFN